MKLERVRTNQNLHLTLTTSSLDCVGDLWKVVSVLHHRAAGTLSLRLTEAQEYLVSWKDCRANCVHASEVSQQSGNVIG